MSAEIVAVHLAAAHEGVAEIIVDLRFPNGGISQVPLDRHAGAALMAACGARTADDLIGESWDKVRDALQAGYSRFTANSNDH